MHKIIINGIENSEELSKYYCLSQITYCPGEKVVFSVPSITDTRYSITSDQVRFSSEGNRPGGGSCYSFIMPDTDVEIKISTHSTMMNPFINGANMPGMGMMGMNVPVDRVPVIDPDPYPWDGKPKFCSECGVPTYGANKFCIECGARLLPVGQ